jgi:hyperosmotically inducible protein
MRKAGLGVMTGAMAAALAVGLSACAAALLSGAAGQSGSADGNGAPQASRVAADDAITSSVHARLMGDPIVKALSLNVSTTGSIVTLGGVVESAAQRAVAERDARSVKGVKGVRNDVTVRTK